MGLLDEERKLTLLFFGLHPKEVLGASFQAAHKRDILGYFLGSS
jgi:hypothetical protein